MRGQRRWLYPSSSVPDQRFVWNVPSARNTHTVYPCKRRASSTRAHSPQVMEFVILRLPSWDTTWLRRNGVKLSWLRIQMLYLTIFPLPVALDIRWWNVPPARTREFWTFKTPQKLLSMMRMIRCSPPMVGTLRSCATIVVGVRSCSAEHFKSAPPRRLSHLHS